MTESVIPSAIQRSEVVGGHSPLYTFKIQIKGFLKTSLIDWDGYITAVAFLPLCNMRCPMCHNHEIVLKPEDYPDISLNEIEKYIVENRDFVDGVVITGGEPTLHSSLPDFCRWLKNLGMLVKIDTNGTNPDMLKNLIDNNLIDYVAMDIKAPLDADMYEAASGVFADVEKIRRSIGIIMNSGLNYEFRITVVPVFHTPDCVVDIARDIEGAKLFVIQQFNPENTLDPKLRKVEPYSREELKEMAERCRPFVSEVKVRA